MPAQKTEQDQLVFSSLENEADILRFGTYADGVIETMTPTAVFPEQTPKAAPSVGADGSRVFVVAVRRDFSLSIRDDSHTKDVNLTSSPHQI
ncbi:MAG TPA: hypothetical protein VH188_02565 [Chthoniobacterales bacterium]|jgi:hypothetical protein|nr:hypothetical protein [Chthoniobacterales bacterium]